MTRIQITLSTNQKKTRQQQLLAPLSAKGCIVKPAFFECLLFHEFHDLSIFTKTTGREYSKSHAILVYYLVQQAKMPN